MGTKNNKICAEIVAVLKAEGIQPDSLGNRLIANLQDIMDSFLQERAKNEFWRISLILISAVLLTGAIVLQTVWGFLLVVLIMVFVVWTGPKIQKKITRIDQSISATKNLVVELLKEEILKKAQSA